MQTADAAVYTELLLHIGSSHDENGSKYAVRRLGELLGDRGGGTTGWEGLDSVWCSAQLLRLWDCGVVKNATPRYVECFCGIFRRLGLCGVLVHPKRVRIVHSLLSSGNRTKVSCGLHILKDVAEGAVGEGVGMPGDVGISPGVDVDTHASKREKNGPAIILDAVDFSLGALGTVGVPPKVTGGKLMNATARDEDGVYARGLWRSRDLAKVPTRVGYVAFWVGMMRACGRLGDVRTLARVLGLREFMGSVLNYASRDPWDVQEEVLGVVKVCVLDLDDVVMTAVTKWGALGEGRFFGQLGQIVEQSCLRLEEGGEEDEELDTVRRVLALASELLTRVMGLVGGVGSGAEAGLSGLLAVSAVPQRVVKPVLGLRPARCYEHARAMYRAFERNPLTAVVYLRGMNQEVDMKKEATFLVNASLLVGAYEAVAGLLKQVSSQPRPSFSPGSPKRLPSSDLVRIWMGIFPTGGISKAVLSKGLQHSQPLVAHATVLLLNSMFSAMERLLTCLRAIGDEYARHRCDAFSAVLDHSKMHLPGVQLVIGYHSKMDFDGLRPDVPSHTLSGILRLLGRWSRLFPDTLIEENVQLERMLLHERVLRLHPSNRLEVVRVLLRGDGGGGECDTTCVESTAMGSSAAMTSLLGLDVILKLALRESSTGSRLYDACAKLSQRYLSGTKLMFDEHNASMGSISSHAVVWTRHAGRHGVATDAVVDFFIEALKMTIKKPMAYVDMAEAFSNQCGYSDCISPLLACSIEKLCRVLKSRAKDDLYKAAIVRFVRGVLDDLAADSSSPEVYAMLIKHVVDIEFPAIATAEAGAEEIPSVSKRQRRGGQLAKVVQRLLAGATGVENASITQWIARRYEEGFSVLAKDGIEADPKAVSGKKKTRLIEEGSPAFGTTDRLADVHALLKALEEAKKATSKYQRRLQLAVMAPSVEALVVQPLSDGDMFALCEAFSGPILQYFASRDVQVPENAGTGDANHFLALRSLSSETIVRVLRGRGRGPGGSSPSAKGGVEGSTLKLAEPLLRTKEAKRSGDSYCNASGLDKLRVLGAVIAALTPSSTSSPATLPSDALARYTCRAATLAMSYIGDDGPARQLAVDLIESLGDIVSDFGSAARGLGEFEQMLDAWSTVFVPSAIGGAVQSAELTRCLRRFSASLIPDDEEAPLVTGEHRIASIYSDVCSLFLELITKEFVQDSLRCDDRSGVPPAYLSNRLPLESIVACAARGTMTRDTFAYRHADMDSKLRLRIEMCEFLETMLDIIASLERDAPADVVGVFAASFDKAELVLLQYLMATYGASLSQADISTWSLIRVINERLWRRRLSGEGNGSNMATCAEGDSDELTLLALLDGPIASEIKYIWGFHGHVGGPLEGLNPLRCAMTVVDFPEWRHLVEVDRLPDSVDHRDAPPEHCMSYEAAGYDPAFFLPMCLFYLRSQSTTAPLHWLLTDTAALPMILRCLGSADVHVRAVAYECLALIERDTPPLFDDERRDVSRLRLLLDWVRQSTVLPFHRFPSVHAVFAAEVSHALFQPGGEAYPIATKHLCKFAALDLQRIISIGPKGSQPGWLRRLLLCGLRSSSDVYLYSKNHIFELSMALASSTQQPNRDLAVMLLHQAGSIPKAARVMTESCGALGWLTHAISEANYRCNRDDEIALLDLLERTWRRMTSWRGIVERGTERCRSGARRDLAIAQARLKN